MLVLDLRTVLKGNVTRNQAQPDQSAVRILPVSLVIAPNTDVYVGNAYCSGYIHQYKNQGE